MEGVKGYKVFNPDWTCREFQYEVGKTYEMDEVPKCCNTGFHFCKYLKDCFSYYLFNPENKVAEIIALGDIVESPDDSKCCTNKIHIVKEMSWGDVLRMVNIGINNTGLCNSGIRNSGNWNCGDFNSGIFNSGDQNSGRYNSGNYNSGNYNSGGHNSGNFNCGGCNSGNWNAGYYNNGNLNSGDHNSGNYNTGDWNKTNFSNGCFNTKEQNITLFNKSSDWSYRDWLNSNAKFILDGMTSDNLEWIWADGMTDEEKSEYPEYKTTGGYLKMCKTSQSSQMWWDNLADYDKNEVKSLPNFDADIFEEITGIKV